MTVSLCILVGLSIFSAPVFAGSSQIGSRWLAPYTNIAPIQPVPVGHYNFDYTATQTFRPVNLTDINYKSLASVGGKITASGDLTFSSDSMVSTGDTVYLVCTPKTSSSSQLVTPSLRPLVIGSQGSWNQTVQDYNVLGIITDPADLNGVIDLSFDLPPDGDYQPIYLDGADSVVNMVDNYPGPWLMFNEGVRNGVYFSFCSSSYLYIPSDYDLPASEQPGLSLRAGNTYRVSFPIICPNNSLQPVIYHALSYDGDSTNLDYTSSIGDLYVRNIGTAANPVRQYIYWVTFDISCYNDTILRHIYIYSGYGLISGFGNYPSIEIIDSDAAVVSKLQQLLDYYSQNPPEADDLKAQSDMQKALEDAAMEDARNSVSTSASQAAPGTVIIEGAGISIASSISSWASAITAFMGAVPWLGVVMAFFVFTTIIKFLISR